MTARKPLFKPAFTPIPPDIDIPSLVHQIPNFQWCHREDSRLHSPPYHKLTQTIHAVTIERGLPIVVDNWHLRQDWNASVFSTEWVAREHGKDDIVVRDLGKQQDVYMSLEQYLKLVPALAGQDFKKDPKAKRQYGKDIDCPQEWRKHLAELLPREISYLGDNDLMTKLPPAARAENMMIYIGHEGTYTPAHKDMCATYAQNIMVSTSPNSSGVEGLAYWFVFSARDRKRVADYWNTLGHDIDTEHFFASLEDLKGFPGNVWVIEQRIGDFVIIPPLGAHQVYNHGGMTIKAAWNRTTIDTLELSITETLPAYRIVCRDEQYKNKAIIHQSLLSLSRFPPSSLLSSPFRHDSFMRLFRLYTSLLVDEFIPPDMYVGVRMEKISQDFNVACSFCRTNIWNRFLTCKQCLQRDGDGDIDSYDICMECFARGRSCRDVTGLEWVQQEKWSELMNLWERCRGIYQFLGGNDIDDFHISTTVNLGRKTLAHVCAKELIRRPNPHTTNTTAKEGLCHTCKIRHPNWKMAFCTKEGCNRAYCFGNLFRQFDEDPFSVLSKLEGYTCPVCRGICNCGACRKRKDQIGYEPKLRSVGVNPRLVADLRSVESLVESNRTNTRWHLETKGTLTTKTHSRDPEHEPSPSLDFDTSQRRDSSTFLPSPSANAINPVLLDPEMSSYFFGQDHPPRYSEISPTNHHSSLSPSNTRVAHPTSSPTFTQQMLVDPENSWLNFDDPFDAYIAEPFPAAEASEDTSILDPSLFTPSTIAPVSVFPTPRREFEARNISISPALLDKSMKRTEEVVWYSSKEVQIGGPPPEIHGRKGKSQGVGKGKGRQGGKIGRDDKGSPAKGSPAKDVQSIGRSSSVQSVKEKSLLSSYGEGNGNGKVKSNDKGKGKSKIDGLLHDTLVEILPKSTTPIPSTSHETLISQPSSSGLKKFSKSTETDTNLISRTIETGLPAFPRLKLVFRQPPTPGTKSNPLDLDSLSPDAPVSPPSLGPGIREFVGRPYVRRITPPAAMDVSGGRLPTARELRLDENTPPPGSAVVFNRTMKAVRIPPKEGVIKNEDVESVGESPVERIPAQGSSEGEGIGTEVDFERRPSKRMRVEVVIPQRKIQKELYTFCLGREARQFLFGQNHLSPKKSTT